MPRLPRFNLKKSERKGVRHNLGGEKGSDTFLLHRGEDEQTEDLEQCHACPCWIGVDACGRIRPQAARIRAVHRDECKTRALDRRPLLHGRGAAYRWQAAAHGDRHAPPRVDAGRLRRPSRPHAANAGVTTPRRARRQGLEKGSDTFLLYLKTAANGRRFFIK